jgi:hypothetical protein
MSEAKKRTNERGDDRGGPPKKKGYWQVSVQVASPRLVHTLFHVKIPVIHHCQPPSPQAWAWMLRDAQGKDAQA